MQLQVLYEDNHLIAVVKPSGILSQGDKTGDPSIFDEVKKYLMEKKNKKTPSNPSGQAGNVFVGLLHRLDRPVSGIILFAKTSKGASRLSEQFRNHAIEKIYYAIVVGQPKQKRGILVDKIQKSKIKSQNYNSKFKSTIQDSTGKEALLQYEIVKTDGKYSLLKIKLETGKFHQIRAQLAAAGHPVLGDVKYGGPKWDNPKAIALCATNLSFQTATEDKMINLSIEMPKEWSKYLV